MENSQNKYEFIQKTDKSQIFIFDDQKSDNLIRMSNNQDLNEKDEKSKKSKNEILPGDSSSYLNRDDSLVLDQMNFYQPVTNNQNQLSNLSFTNKVFSDQIQSINNDKSETNVLEEEHQYRSNNYLNQHAIKDSQSKYQYQIIILDNQDNTIKKCLKEKLDKIKKAQNNQNLCFTIMNQQDIQVPLVLDNQIQTQNQNKYQQMIVNTQKQSEILNPYEFDKNNLSQHFLNEYSQIIENLHQKKLFLDKLISSDKYLDVYQGYQLFQEGTKIEIVIKVYYQVNSYKPLEENQKQIWPWQDLQQEIQVLEFSRKEYIKIQVSEETQILTFQREYYPQIQKQLIQVKHNLRPWSIEYFKYINKDQNLYKIKNNSLLLKFIKNEDLILKKLSEKNYFKYFTQQIKNQYQIYNF